MTFLVDTHLLLWFVLAPEKMSEEATAVLGDASNQLMFSTVSIWEVAIKFGLKRNDFTVSPKTLRRELLHSRFDELTITSEQAFAVSVLPPIHADPFDRLLIAQALVEDVTLLTADGAVASYPGPIRFVG